MQLDELVRYLDDYLATMELLCVQALSPRETRDALVALRDDLRG